MLNPFTFTLIGQSTSLPLPFSEWLEQRGHIGHLKSPSILLPKSTYSTSRKRDISSKSISEKTDATALAMLKGAEPKPSIPQSDDSLPLYLRYTYKRPCITNTSYATQNMQNTVIKSSASIPLYIQYGKNSALPFPILSSADPRLCHGYIPPPLEN